MTKANEAKKNYLMRYIWSEQRIDELELELNQYRLKALPGAITYDGMPKGNFNSSDLSGYAAKIGDILLSIKLLRDKTLEEISEISQAIERVSDIRYVTLLRYRYLQKKGWKEIAVMMGYSLDHIYKLHGQALEAFEIPER